MKDIDYALMLIKANKLDGAKDILEELLKSDPGIRISFTIWACAIRNWTNLKRL